MCKCSYIHLKLAASKLKYANLLKSLNTRGNLFKTFSVFFKFSVVLSVSLFSKKKKCCVFMFFYIFFIFSHIHLKTRYVFQRFLYISFQCFNTATDKSFSEPVPAFLENHVISLNIATSRRSGKVKTVKSEKLARAIKIVTDADFLLAG